MGRTRKAWQRPDADRLLPLSHDWVRVRRHLDRAGASQVVPSTLIPPNLEFYPPSPATIILGQFPSRPSWPAPTW